MPLIWQGKNAYHEEDYTGGTAFLIGKEGKGLTEEAAEAGRLSDTDSHVRSGGISECSYGCRDTDV